MAIDAITADPLRDKDVQVATKTGYNVMRSSAATLIEDIDRRNRDWLTAMQSSRQRLRTNMRMYVPTDGSSWDDESYRSVVNDGRHAVSFDIASRKIDSLAGAIRAEKWDFDFQPLNIVDAPLLKRMKLLYAADKEQYDYDVAESRCLVRGLIHSGFEEMVLDYDIRPTGGIKFICPQSGMVLRDPYWVTDDLADWKRAIKHSWFTAGQIIEKWEITDPFIRQQAELDISGGESYGTLAQVDEFVNAPERWGSKHLVIEYRWIEEKKTTRLYGKAPDGEWVEFPVDIKDRNDVQDFMAANGIHEWRSLRELPYTMRTLKLGVCCPSLSRTTLLYEGDHDIQCGVIGFFPFSACHEMGIDKGIMDAAVDVQRTLNYRESKKDDILASMASDFTLINLDALDNGKADIDEINKNRTKPGYTMGVHGDPSKAIYKAAHGQVPPDIWRDIDQLVGMFDRVLPITPALEGTGSRDESGVLFEMRHAVSKLGTLILYDNWRQHLMNKASAWYSQALVTYKNVRRNVSDTESNRSFEFNKPVYIVEGGEVRKAFENHIGSLPRAKVYVGLRKDSPTQRMADRAMLYDVTKILSAHPDLFRSQIMILTNEILRTIELDPEQKQQVERVGKLQEVRDLLAVAGEIENIKAGAAQAQVMQAQAMQMLQQLSQQMGGQPGGGGQGMPEEGADQTSRPQALPMPEDAEDGNAIGSTDTTEAYTQVPTDQVGGIPTG
jgi:hypothetical protein